MIGHAEVKRFLDSWLDIWGHRIGSDTAMDELESWIVHRIIDTAQQKNIDGEQQPTTPQGMPPEIPAAPVA